MRKLIRLIASLSFGVCTAIFALVGTSYYMFPDEIPVVSSSVSNENGIYTVENNDNRTATIKVFGIPVKTATMTQVNRSYVVVSGDVFGIRLYSDGIVIVGSGPVTTNDSSVNPALSSGLKVGDVIKAINGHRVTRNSDLSEAVEGCKGKPIELLVERGDERKVVIFTPALSAEDNKYKAGLWIRDSTAGIGTMTYFDPEKLTFAGLGHGICDVDTGEIMPLFGGDAVHAQIIDVYKGSKSETGELCGTFEDEIIGPLVKNTDYGIFGSITGDQIEGIKMPVAMKYEVKIGKAEIISKVDGNSPKRYEIEITRLYFNADGSKNMAITVTDQELLAKTGGIIQGMSGSPILQNGMLVGAVTHVLVDNPSKGYGIFAETMMNAE